MSTRHFLDFTKDLTTYLACGRSLHDRSFLLFTTPVIIHLQSTAHLFREDQPREPGCPINNIKNNPKVAGGTQNLHWRPCVLGVAGSNVFGSTSWVANPVCFNTRQTQLCDSDCSKGEKLQSEQLFILLLTASLIHTPCGETYKGMEKWKSK